MFSRFSFLLGMFFAPTLVWAQTTDALSIARTLINQLSGVINGQLIPITFTLAILVFFWGIVRYVYSQSTEDKVAGKGIIVWSLIAVFIMVSVYGIIYLMQITFGIVPSAGTFRAPSILGR